MIFFNSNEFLPDFHILMNCFHFHGNSNLFLSYNSSILELSIAKLLKYGMKTDRGIMTKIFLIIKMKAYHLFSSSSRLSFIWNICSWDYQAPKGLTVWRTRYSKSQKFWLHFIFSLFYILHCQPSLVFSIIHMGTNNLGLKSAIEILFYIYSNKYHQVK